MGYSYSCRGYYPTYLVSLTLQVSSGRCKTFSQNKGTFKEVYKGTVGVRGLGLRV